MNKEYRNSYYHPEHTVNHSNGNGVYDHENFVNSTTSHEVIAPSHITVFEQQVAAAPSLEELDRRFHLPHERKDNGTIEYTTMPETIRQWAKDPHGETTFRFISNAYGIEEERLPQVLEKAGLQEYMRFKEEGRFVGMVATQVPKPTYYFMSNPLMLGQLNRRGIPTALLLGEYPKDTFHSGNSDKRGAFGKVEFPVGTEQKIAKSGKEYTAIKTVGIELKPYGIREDDGTIRRINSINEANGYRCEQILVQAVDAYGPDSQQFTQHSDSVKENTQGGKPTKLRDSHTRYEAAIGMSIPGLVNRRHLIDKKEDISHVAQDAISMTEFYRLLWVETIHNLRESGELPSEEEMPMTFVDAGQMYKTLAEEANPPYETLVTLGLGSDTQMLSEVFKLSPEEITEIVKTPDGVNKYLQSKGLVRLENGLLAHANGILDPGCYYSMHIELTNSYCECSSCGGKEFVGKLARAQQLRKNYGLHEKEVRLPDQEFPELEQHVIHPTGKYYNQPRPIDPEVPLLEERANAISQKARGEKDKGKKTELIEMAKKINEEISKRQAEAAEAHHKKVGEFNKVDYQNQSLHIPEIIAAVYKELYADTDKAILEPEVQEAIRHIRNRKAQMV